MEFNWENMAYAKEFGATTLALNEHTQGIPGIESEYISIMICYVLA